VEKEMLSRLPADKASADIRPLVVDGTPGIGKKFAAVFDDQFTAAGKGEVETVSAQISEPDILAPGDVHGGKHTTAISIALPAALQVSQWTVQQDASPFHPVASESNLDNGFFLVKVGTNYRKEISPLSSR